MDISVVITVPHSMCNTNVHERHCDSMAEDAAVSLYQMIPYEKHIMLADEYRYDIDLNRDVSRNTDFRKRISELIRIPNKFVLVLDIHSFDEGYADGEIVILTGMTCRTGYIQRLYENLRHNHVNVKIFDTLKSNDIYHEASLLNLFCVLIEYSEYLQYDRLKFINEIITSWIKSELDNDIILPDCYY